MLLTCFALRDLNSQHRLWSRLLSFPLTSYREHPQQAVYSHSIQACFLTELLANHFPEATPRADRDVGCLFIQTFVPLTLPAQPEASQTCKHLTSLTFHLPQSSANLACSVQNPGLHLQSCFPKTTGTCSKTTGKAGSTGWVSEHQTYPVTSTCFQSELAKLEPLERSFWEVPADTAQLFQEKDWRTYLCMCSG